jgi:hypothetical protein
MGQFRQYEVSPYAVGLRTVASGRLGAQSGLICSSTHPHHDDAKRRRTPEGAAPSVCEGCGHTVPNNCF